MTREGGLRIALFGRPLGHSRSRDLFVNASDHEGPDVGYVPMDVDEGGLREGFDRLRGGDLDGANVTVPYKLLAARHCDRLSGTARESGAVNVLTRTPHGTIEGSNTDGRGFTRSLRRELAALPARSALVLGTGGAARAVAGALGALGFSITAVTRAGSVTADGPRHFRALGHRVIDWSPGPLGEELARSALIVQATPVGTESFSESRLDLPLGILREDQVVADLVYRPWETDFLARARSRGARGVNGWPMLVEQAALALDRWAGAGAGESVRRTAAALEPRDSWRGGTNRSERGA